MLAAEMKPIRGGESWPEANQANGPSWNEISAQASPFLSDVRCCLEAQIATFEDEVAEGARYALSASGKQLRPLLVALSARAAGELQPGHITGAAIVELVHLATLVHDDVIDSADLRRQQATVAARYGNQTAVLLGDCLFAHALKLAASFPTPEVCRVVSDATKAVCSGEILQTLGKGRLDQPLDDYFRIIELKTAELFALACDLGALLASAPPARRAALRRFGVAFGTAYQVFDDCLDLFGDEEIAGKTLGTDVATGKATLPLILTHQKATPADRIHLERLLTRPGSNRGPGLRTMLARYGAASLSCEMMESYLVGARDALVALDGADGRASLLALTRYLGAQVSRLGPT
jgi:octaprenyl-diphosphate synthase